MSDVKHVGVIGAGLMGRGIAEAAITSGLPTTLLKATGGAKEIAAARDQVAATLTRAVERGKLTAEAKDAALARLTVSADLDALSSCDIVIESVVEDLAVKQHLFADVEKRTRGDAVLGTNTSSLRVSAIGASLRVPARLVGIHFFSPVAAMKLVEVAPTQTTAPFAVERAQALCRALGKHPVVVGDSSGYIVNRLLVPYLLDGILALESGIATPDDIDAAMKLGCGHPLGPLALADAIGLDVVYAMARNLYLSLQDRRYSPPALLRRLVLAGHLGKKAKRGIYDYSTNPPRENPALHLLPDAPAPRLHATPLADDDAHDNH